MSGGTTTAGSANTEQRKGLLWCLNWRATRWGTRSSFFRKGKYTSAQIRLAFIRGIFASWRITQVGFVFSSPTGDQIFPDFKLCFSAFLSGLEFSFVKSLLSL